MEVEGFAAAVAGVELYAGFVERAGVVHGDDVAFLGLACAFDDFELVDFKVGTEGEGGEEGGEEEGEGGEEAHVGWGGVKVVGWVGVLAGVVVRGMILIV